MADQNPQPLQPFFHVHQEVQRLFHEMIYKPWGATPSTAAEPAWQPRCDVAETETEIVIEVELPGVTRKDVHVEVEGDTLRIRGERRGGSERRRRHYHHVERHYGRFERHLRLPTSVDREAIRARFHAGILTITLPKKPRASARKEAS